MRKHLLIPDSHSGPDEDLRRYDWLGELIMMEMPDVIIDIGDWYDMASLCEYDKGTKSFHGRNYKADIEAGKEAERRAFGPIVRYNNTRTKWKKKQYKPLIIRCKGNHEYRINRVLQSKFELEGILDPSHTDLNVQGLEVVNTEFLQRPVVDGVAYSHYFASGVMGRPVSSPQTLLRKAHMSVTMGHTHTKGCVEDVRADGTRIHGLVCGSFHDINHKSTYANEQAQDLWWNGLHIKERVSNGDYDRTEFSIKRLMELMGESEDA